ncbi:MAG: phosphatase PAP2 family protein [Bacteroidales bacterium]
MSSNKTILHAIAQFISVLFNPLVIPSLGTLMIFHAGNIFNLWPSTVVAWIVFVISLGTLWLPLVVLQLLKQFQYITDLRMNGMKERILPYTLVLIIFLITYFMIRHLIIPDVVDKIILSSCIAISVNIIFLFYWKISSHAMGAGGLLALSFVLFLRWQATNFTLLYLVILIAGMVCWARLWLEAHTEKQVYAGLSVGFAITAFVLSYF